MLLLLPALRPADCQVPVDPVERARGAVARLISGHVSGTGFLVSEDGVMVTACHVVSDLQSVWAHFADGTAVQAEGLLAFDPENDVAVLKLRADQLPRGLPIIPIRVPEAQRAGDAAWTVGYPGDAGIQQLSRGVVLVAWANPPPADRAETTKHSARRYAPIQFDAPVSPGCSGSPLFDSEGYAIGVVASHIGKRDGVGFATSIGVLSPFPVKTGVVQSFSDAAKSFDGTPLALSMQASSLLHFWEEQSQPGHNEEWDYVKAPWRSEAARSGAEFALKRFRQAAFDPSDHGDAAFNAAICCWRLGRKEEAVASMVKAVQVWPDNVAGHLLLAKSYASAWRRAESEAEARKIVALSPVFAAGRRALADALMIRRQYGAAATELSALVKLRPYDFTAYFDLDRMKKLERDVAPGKMHRPKPHPKTEP